MTIRRATVVGMAAVVAACAKVEMIPSPFAGCDTVPPGVFEQVDWDAARKIVVHIRHGEFDPTLIRLMQGRPYVMRIENRDRQFRRLQSADFFEAVYIHSVVSGPDGPQSTSCPSGIRVSPGEAAEVRFIAARDGRYEYSDTMIPYAFGGIAGGIVRIEPMPMLLALASPIVPGITAPEDVPTGPYTPTAEPAALPMIPPQPEAPAAPAEPAALPKIPDEPPPPPAKPATKPKAKIAPEPAPQLSPEPAPQLSPPKSPSLNPAPGKKDGIGLFGL